MTNNKLEIHISLNVCFPSQEKYTYFVVEIPDLNERIHTENNENIKLQEHEVHEYLKGHY